tara:strand:+ start:1941 stop:3179 length:1239 start_codon:yes stop_codon:yes gene_type:complete
MTLLLRLTVSAAWLLLTPLAAMAQSGKPSEVQSFWLTPSEKSALNELRIAFTARGGVWIDFQTRDAADNRNLAFQRIVRGTPPFAIQWFAGKDLRAMSQSGVIHDLTSIAKAGDWTSKLRPDALSRVTIDGAVYGLPIGMHTENWAWFNRKLLNQLGVAVPRDWDDVIRVLALAQRQGIDGIAIGQGGWERHHLFNTVLMSEGGSEPYRQLMEQADATALNDPAFARTFSLVDSLRMFDPQDSTVTGWKEATEKLAAGKAVVQFMGDWVLPELTTLGLKAGQDFECTLALGKVRQPVSVVDIMIFPIDEDRSLTPEHQRMIDAVLDPDTQLAFARAKGAISVLNKLESDPMDICMRKAYDLQNETTSAPATVMIVNERVAAIMEQVVNDFWQRKIDTPEEALALLKQGLATQ